VRKADANLRLTGALDIMGQWPRKDLEWFAHKTLPHAAAADRRLRAEMRSRLLHQKAQKALLAITTGEAARMLAAGKQPGDFFEQVEYNARRLAKFNLSPNEVTQILAAYNRVLDGRVEAGFEWQKVRDRLHTSTALTLNNAFYQVRESETETFYELYRAETESGSFAELLDRYLAALLRFSRAEEAHLWFWRAAHERWECRASAARNGRISAPAPVVVSRRRQQALSRPRSEAGDSLSKLALDPTWAKRYRHCWSLPLSENGRLAGVMQFAFDKPYDWLPREMELLTGAAERCVSAAERARLIEDLAQREDQIRKLGEHMLHVEEVERQRISRELHDEAGQSLLCIRLALEVMEQSCSAGPELKEKLSRVREVTEKTIVEIRRLIKALSPSVLEQFGLAAAIRQLVAQFHQVHPARVRLQMGRLAHLPKKTEIMVYRLVQECFNNIVKHSSASAVNVFLSSADGVLRLQVEDNGVGFQVEPAFGKQNSFGIAGMRERVALLGGSFHLVSHPAGPLGKGPQGTRIRIELPLPRESAAEGKMCALQA
jgi:signal transduction histidine kinase